MQDKYVEPLKWNQMEIVLDYRTLKVPVPILKPSL